MNEAIDRLAAAVERLATAFEANTAAMVEEREFAKSTLLRIVGKGSDVENLTAEGTTALRADGEDIHAE